MPSRARKRALRFRALSWWQRVPAVKDQFQRSPPTLNRERNNGAHHARLHRRQRVVSQQTATNQSAARSSVMNVQAAPDTTFSLPEPFLHWFASRGWAPREHQLELLAKARAGRSVLLIAPTGAGKTLAGFLPSLVELSTAARGAETTSLPGAVSNIEGERSVRPISTGRGIRRDGGLHTL